jgi:hypothetical protein
MMFRPPLAYIYIELKIWAKTGSSPISGPVYFLPIEKE